MKRLSSNRTASRNHQLFLATLGIPGNLYVLYLYLTVGDASPSHSKATSGKQAKG